MSIYQFFKRAALFLVAFGGCGFISLNAMASETFNRQAAIVNDVVITKHEVDLYRSGKIYNGLNPKATLQPLSYKEALEELIDLQLELQMLRLTLGEKRFDTYANKLLDAYLEATKTTRKEFKQRIAREYKLDGEYLLTNFKEILLLQRARHERFGAKKFTFSTKELDEARALIEQRSKPTVTLYTLKVQRFTVANQAVSQPVSSASTSFLTKVKTYIKTLRKTIMAKHTKNTKQVNSGIQNEEQLVQHLNQIYAQPKAVTELAADHPKVKLDEQLWTDVPLNNLPDVFAAAIANLPSGQTTKPIQTDNGIYLLTLRNVRTHQFTAEELGENAATPRISDEDLKAFLTYIKWHELSRKRVQEEVKPQAFIKRF